MICIYSVAFARLFDVHLHTLGNLSTGTSNLMIFFTTELVDTPGAPCQPIEDAWKMLIL